MKKKISLILVLLIISLLPLFSLTSCFRTPFRPSGSYVSETYKNPDSGYEYRFIIKFQEESFRNQIAKGKVSYAYQFKKPDGKWKTSDIYNDLPYEIDNKSSDGINYINAPKGKGLKAKSYLNSDNSFDASTGEKINNVELEVFREYDPKKKFLGYSFKAYENPFPTAVDPS